MIFLTRQQKNNQIDDVNQLIVRGTPGEHCSTRLEMVSTDKLSELTIQFSAAVQSSVKTKLFLVKRWHQAGVGIYQSESVEVEELLVKDDRFEFHDMYKATRRSWKHTFQPLQIYEPPDVPSHPELRTTLEKNQPKSFLIQIQIPKNTEVVPPIHLEFVSSGSIVRTLDVQIEILPFTLTEPTQSLFMWFKGKLDWRDPQHYLTEDQYRAQLQDIYAHGFTSISINEVDTELAQRAVAIAEEVGFSQDILFVPPLPAVDKLQFRRVTPVVYVSDELDMHAQSADADKATALTGFHKLNSQRAAAFKAKTMSSIVNNAFIKRLRDPQDIGFCPNTVSLYLNKNKEYLQFASQLADSNKLRLFYYWQCFMEKPNLNRVLTGVYLWKSQAAGISPYCYQHMPQYPNSPYNDFDEWEPEFHEGEIRRPFKDHMTTYPAKNNSVPTLQWEGLRDGITDLKYLHTLHQIIDEAASSDDPATRALAADVSARTNIFLSRISLTNIEINSETQIEPYQDIDATDYDDFRNQMIDDILLLKDNQAKMRASGR